LVPSPHYGCPTSLGFGSTDITYEQLWNTDKWGKYFFAFPILTPGGNGNWGGMLGLVANENNTNITVFGDINGGTPINYTLDAGEKQYVCYVMMGLTRIIADKPIMVFLLLPDVGVMSILPVDQRIQHALVAPFILSSASNINQHGIDLLVPAAYWDKTVIYPAGSSVEAATTPSRHHVVGKFFKKNTPKKIRPLRKFIREKFLFSRRNNKT